MINETSDDGETVPCISLLDNSERSIWEFAFRNALQRFLLHDEWTGIQSRIARDRADEAVREYRKRMSSNVLG